MCFVRAACDVSGVSCIVGSNVVVKDQASIPRRLRNLAKKAPDFPWIGSWKSQPDWSDWSNWSVQPRNVQVCPNVSTLGTTRSYITAQEVH